MYTWPTVANLLDQKYTYNFSKKTKFVLKKNEKEIISLFLGVKSTINSCHIDAKIVLS